MSTRCIIDIRNSYELVRLCKHWDGYPENMVPLIREVELWLKSVLTSPESHLAGELSTVVLAFSQYESNCLKITKAEAQAEDEKWHKFVSPFSDFAVVNDNRTIDFDAYFDIEFYYVVDVSTSPWLVSSYEVVRDYELALEEGRPPAFIGLRSYEPNEVSPPSLIKCAFCGDLYPKEMIVRHHKQPKAQGGKGKPFNRQYVCANCHSLRHRHGNRGFSTAQAKLL